MVPGKLVPEKMVLENSETKNHGVSVEHRGVCMYVCMCVWNVWMCSIYENLKLDNKPPWTPLVFYSLVHVGPWGDSQTSLCVCVYWNQSIKIKKSLKFPSILLTENNFWRTFFRRSIFRGSFFRVPTKAIHLFWYAEKWSPENGPQEKWFPENRSPEKWSPENWPPEKRPSKIFLRQKNVRKFERLFNFYQLIPLHTQKDVWRWHSDPTYVPNYRTLKESRKICCRVLGFHRLITSEHSAHTHNTMLDAHPTIFCFHVLGLFPSFGFVIEFWVFIDWSHPNIPHTHHDARRPPHDFSFLNFPGIIFPGFISDSKLSQLNNSVYKHTIFCYE